MKKEYVLYEDGAEKETVEFSKMGGIDLIFLRIWNKEDQCLDKEYSIFYEGLIDVLILAAKEFGSKKLLDRFSHEWDKFFE